MRCKMHRNFKFLIKSFFLLITLGLMYVLITICTLSSTTRNLQQPKVAPASGAKKDWHDYKAMHSDAQRIGTGEQANDATLNADTDRELEKTMSLEFGFNALLSDAISVNRSIGDSCLQKTYLAELPEISVIIPFYNEHFSVLLRSVHSIINRTPPELLREIILLDDFSDNECLGQQLDQYVADHFDKVQIVHLPERMGLIRASMVGARKATAEVLVIFDAHIEVNYNWLPSLLEPIALDKRTAVCPLIDTIHYSNFEYHIGFLHGGRGGFDWNMRYIQVKLLPEDMVDNTKPYKNPVMNGGLLAISADFFWELGGYDEGLDIWVLSTTFFIYHKKGNIYVVLK